MKCGRAIAWLVIAIAAIAVPVSAHEAVKAVIVLRPGTPRVGEPCNVSVSVLVPPGLPILDQIQGVRIIGEMTGHAMTPVEVSLARAGGNAIYAGSFALTMAGPWKMTVRVNVMKEEMWAEFPAEALRAAAPPDKGGMRHVVELRDPVRANVLSPWTVVGVSLGLVAGIEGLALFFKWRRAHATRRQPRGGQPHADALAPTARVGSVRVPGP